MTSRSPQHIGTHIVVRKKERNLTVYKNGELVKTYSMVLGFDPIGNKALEGDGKTPEGEFYIFTKNPESKYFLSLGISYPGVAEAKRGLAAGLITLAEHDKIRDAIRAGKKPPQETALGGEIYIHGSGIDGDWTCGCVAATDIDMQEIYDAAEVGTVVTILP